MPFCKTCLGHARACYAHDQQMVVACDLEIARLRQTFESKVDVPTQPLPAKTTIHGRPQCHEPRAFDLRGELGSVGAQIVNVRCGDRIGGMKTNLAIIQDAVMDARVEEGGFPKGTGTGESMSRGSGPGRPCGCTLELVGLLRGLIRELGLSDSAAARRLGIGASTLSRWKREDPEVRLLLQQAREECRAVQLQTIMNAAAAEHGRGWRAAAWLLERLFPEDYMRDAGAREGHRSVAEARERREKQATEAEARWESVVAASMKQDQVAEVASTQEEDCRNCRNSREEAVEGATAFASTERVDDESSSWSQPREVQLRSQEHDQGQLGREGREKGIPGVSLGVVAHGAGVGVAQCFQSVGGSGDFGGAESLEAPKPEHAVFTQEDDCRNCQNAILGDAEGRRYAL